MRPWPVRILSLLLCFSLPALASESKRVPESALESVMTMQIDSQISLDEKGALVAFKIETGVPDVLRQKLERMVGAWRFTPTPSPDGIARPVVSPMRMTLAATKVGEGYRVKVDNVIFPKKTTPVNGESTAGISARKLFPPRYPIGLDRKGVSAIVLVSIRVGADGRVEDAVSVQSMLLNTTGRDSGLAWALKEFEASSLVSARRWQFDVPASLAQADPAARTVNVPIHFISDSRNNPVMNPEAGGWRVEVRTPRREIPWLQAAPGQQRIGVSDMARGDVVPAVGLVKLDTNVIGMDVM